MRNVTEIIYDAIWPFYHKNNMVRIHGGVEAQFDRDKTRRSKNIETDIVRAVNYGLKNIILGQLYEETVDDYEEAMRRPFSALLFL